MKAPLFSGIKSDSIHYSQGPLLLEGKMPDVFEALSGLVLKRVVYFLATKS